jgi:hypothetical protein
VITEAVPDTPRSRTPSVARSRIPPPPDPVPQSFARQHPPTLPAFHTTATRPPGLPCKAFPNCRPSSAMCLSSRSSSSNCIASTTRCQLCIAPLTAAMTSLLKPLLLLPSDAVHPQSHLICATSRIQFCSTRAQLHLIVDLTGEPIKINRTPSMHRVGTAICGPIRQACNHSAIRVRLAVQQPKPRCRACATGAHCTTVCTYRVRYEWDEAKNRRNQRQHGGISFRTSNAGL